MTDALALSSPDDEIVLDCQEIIGMFEEDLVIQIAKDWADYPEKLETALTIGDIASFNRMLADTGNAHYPLTGDAETDIRCLKDPYDVTIQERLIGREWTP
jgi:hypothetical protein